MKLNRSPRPSKANSPVLQLFGTFFLLLGSLMAVDSLGIADYPREAKAASIGVTGPQFAFMTQSANVTWSNNNVTTVSAGLGTDGHTCAIENGNLFCWGWGGSGRLGDGEAGQTRLQPFAVLPGDEGFTQGQVTAVSAGGTFTCAISDSVPYCWGSGSHLGHGLSTDSTVPVRVTLPEGATARAISAGSTHACLVTNAGTVWCWGRGQEGQLGNGATSDSTTAVQVTGLTGVVDVGVGNSHSCALLSSGQVRCWGDNTDGRLGNGSTVASSTPVAVTLAATFPAPNYTATSLAVGGAHSCIVDSATNVRCWGSNTHGQLGRGDTNVGYVPNPPVVSSGFVVIDGQIAVAAGIEHTCALSISGQVRCWGRNNLGQLGDAQKVFTAVTFAQTVPAAGTYTNQSGTDISSGREHTCVTSSGRAYCWGHNHAGRLGNGGNTFNAVLGPVSVFTPPASVSPTTQSVVGVVGLEITSTSALVPTNFSGTVTFSASELPSGLSIASDTGVLSGVPTATSSATVTVTATGATSGTASVTVTFKIVSMDPLTQIVTGTVGSEIVPTTAITTSNFGGTVGLSFAGSLPAGLSFEPATGVVSGTPTAASVSTIIVEANGATSGYAAGTISFDIQEPSANNEPPFDSVETPVTPGAGNTTDTTDPGTPSPNGIRESVLITEELQEQLTAPAGDAKILVGGELVDVALTQASVDLRSVAPADRTPAQIAELQALATTMVNQLREILGADAALPISIRNTPTGAVIVGLARNPVTGEPMEIPVEDVILVAGGGLVLMVSGVDGAQPVKIGLDGALEIPEGGYVSLIAGGLTPGDSGEVVVMSTPRLITDFAVGASGEVSQQAGLPTDLALGDHTVVVTVGSEAASLGFRLVPATSAEGGGLVDSLPATGQDGFAGSWAVLFLALGALTVLISTRRRYT
jgi:alpha-tubulin suppressor-like RCC1 family protein